MKPNQAKRNHRRDKNFTINENNYHNVYLRNKKKRCNEISFVFRIHLRKQDLCSLFPVYPLVIHLSDSESPFFSDTLHNLFTQIMRGDISYTYNDLTSQYNFNFHQIFVFRSHHEIFHPKVDFLGFS